MRTVVPDVTICVDGEAVESETTVSSAGPNVAVLSTALPTLPLTVTTTYVGADDVDTAAVDLALAARPAAFATARQVSRDAIPVTQARERCLLDHLAQVRETAECDRGCRVTVDAADAALNCVATVP